MPGRLTPLVIGEFYHIFNRGSEKRIIFTKNRDHTRFKQTFYYYQYSGHRISFSKFTKSKIGQLGTVGDQKLVSIICYCLMPNHFHFLVKQLTENGISIFLSKLSNSYTKYFNTKYDRVGPLLQGSFKAVHVDTDEQLIHLSRYIHINPVISKLTTNLEGYPWSSYLEYIRQINGVCSKEEILNFFQNTEGYHKFMNDQIDYGMSLHLLKHQVLEEI